MKSKKSFLNMDERNKLVAYKVISIMYFLTLIALQAVIQYRQFALGQSIHDFEDFGIIFTVNSLFLISALLYFGAIPLQKIKLKIILLGYVAIVFLGSIFTYLKYNVFQGADLSVSQMFNKLFIISIICGLIVLFYVILSVLGKRKLDKEIED